MIAILGTGIMGLPMARNLVVAGLDVRAWNRTPDKAQPLADEGVEVASNPADAVRGADLVITMLADGDAVAGTMEDGGALTAMAEGALWIQMSTVGIAANEALQALADERRVTFVDAPVLGTKLPAEKGELLVLASGPEDCVDRCRPVFEAVGSKTLWLGEAGTGTRMKLVLNNWVISLTESLAETIALAESLAIDPQQFLDTIDGGLVGVPYDLTLLAIVVLEMAVLALVFTAIGILLAGRIAQVDSFQAVLQFFVVPTFFADIPCL